uniref:Uncharacterized protein n=1 Tax=Octopus bimaculoides TaxID=37653 RepID=A0A0L8I2W3_OCTBM
MQLDSFNDKNYIRLIDIFVIAGGTWLTSPSLPSVIDYIYRSNEGNDEANSKKNNKNDFYSSKNNDNSNATTTTTTSNNNNNNNYIDKNTMSDYNDQDEDNDIPLKEGPSPLNQR